MILADGDLHDLSLNLRDQIEALAGGPAGLRRVLTIHRGRRPRDDDGYDVSRLLHDRGIIRYREKIEATIHNARAMLVIRGECGSFRRYLRRYGHAEQGVLYADLRRRFRHLGPYAVRTFLRRVGEDVFFSHPDTLRVLYRLGLTRSPRASDEEVGRAHARLAAASPRTRLDEVNRLLTRLGSGYELDEAICSQIPKCHRCQLTAWCWYYRQARAQAPVSGPG